MKDLFMGELIGTMILVLLGNGVVANVILSKTKGNNAGWLTINVGWGIAVVMGAFAAGVIGPAHLNPALSIAFGFMGAYTWSEVAGMILAQMIGAFIGGILVWIMYRPHYEATKDSATILGTFSTGPEIRSTVDNFLSELIGTFILVFMILVFGKYSMIDGLGTLVVGSLIVGIGASLGGTTGYAINPARDLGPRIAHALLPITNKGHSDWQYAWIPVVGPIAGGVIAAFIFQMIYN
ncbi:MIP/aquaporin family protein [Atopobacter phocae]|uniref:MIP/aquaporin family protein n=1 Tax=Atopobacter phocae TaxID=136492 RepID=UPI00047082CB|nr:MIP/aquaporin family protein [Atopobacter phocae]